MRPSMRIHAAQRRIISASLHEMFGELRVLLLGSYQLAVLHLAMAHQLCQRHVTFILYVLPDAAPAAHQNPKCSDTHKVARQASPVQAPYDGRACSKELDGIYIMVARPLSQRFQQRTVHAF